MKYTPCRWGGMWCPQMRTEGVSGGCVCVCVYSHVLVPQQMTCYFVQITQEDMQLQRALLHRVCFCLSFRTAQGSSDTGSSVCSPWDRDCIASVVFNWLPHCVVENSWSSALHCRAFLSRWIRHSPGVNAASCCRRWSRSWARLQAQECVILSLLHFPPPHSADPDRSTRSGFSPIKQLPVNLFFSYRRLIRRRTLMDRLLLD